MRLDAVAEPVEEPDELYMSLPDELVLGEEDEEVPPDDGYDELLLDEGDVDEDDGELLLDDDDSGYELELLELVELLGLLLELLGLLGLVEWLGLLPIVSCDEVLVSEPLVELPPGAVVGDCARTTEANPTAAASPRD